MKNIDTILRGATLLVLLVILYCIAPRRYEYRMRSPHPGTVIDSATGVFLSDNGWEPVTPELQRRRKW